MTKLFHAAAALALLAVLMTPSVANDASAVRSFGRGSWKQLRAAHAGQPTIVHFWGLTCGPCRVEMPAWGRFLAEKPKVDFVTVNADLVPDSPEQAAGFLAQSGLAKAENWIFDDDFVEKLRFEIDPAWQGEIPVTLLIGRDGSVRKIEGSVEIGEVRAWLAGQGA